MPRLIAFDLDGVLYTAEPFLGEAYREAIAAVEARRPGSFPRVPDTAEILEHVGWPVRVILERLFPGVDPQSLRLLYDESLGVICRYVERGEGHLFPGVEATLHLLAERGFVLAVASNGRSAYVESVLRTYELHRFFDPVVTIGTAGVGDKAGVLRSYLERHGWTAADLVMVGDRSSDVDAARSVGCRFIGCDYGHGHRHEIEDAGPILTSITQLPEFVGERADPDGRVEGTG